MGVSTADRERVRERADHACEFCGVSEIDSAAELTIDHFQPRTKDGDDKLENLIYSCYRCNQHKADYWPATDQDLQLWNPRTEPASRHFIELDDGRLAPITEAGSFTLRRLRLNRHLLVAYRLRQRAYAEQKSLLRDYQALARVFDQLIGQQASQMIEQQRLLAELYELLQLFVDPEE